MSDISAKELELLEHSLGLGRKVGAKISYRNYFCTSKSGKDYEIIKELIERGLMEEGKTPESCAGMTFFHVTDLGKKAIGYPFTELE